MAVELLTRIVELRDTPALVPASAADLECLDTLKRRKHALAHPWRTFLRGRPRSRQMEKWYRALVGVVADGVDKHPQVLHCELKYTAGKVLRHIESPLFGTAVELKSCADMDDAEFTAFVRLAVELLFRDVLPGVRRQDVYARVAEITGERKPKMLD